MAATIETTSQVKGLYPDQSFSSRDIVPDSLILQVATITGAPEGDVPQVRVPYVETDPKVGFVKEGDELDRDQHTLNEVLVTTRKLGLITHQSRESSAYAGASGAIAASMQRAITLKADNIFLNSPASPTGIRNLDGVIDAGTVSTDFDPFIDAITGIEANSGQATSIIMDPASWGGSLQAQIRGWGPPARQPGRPIPTHPVRPARVRHQQHGPRPGPRRQPA